MNIIITGASRGIGKELVKLFAQENDHKIIAISRNKMLKFDYLTVFLRLERMWHL